jgi:hypothetical protein
MADDTAGMAQGIDGRLEFNAALLVALDDCARAEVPHLWLSDPDFSAWPLGSVEVVTALTRWIGPRRRLTLIAGDWEHLALRCPRWVAWRRRWSHSVQCLQVREEEAQQVPALLYGPPVVALRLHSTRPRVAGRLMRRAEDFGPLGELIDALTQRTQEGFPVTTLGL